MSARYLAELFTGDVLAAQESHYGRRARIPSGLPADELGVNEEEFIAQRDSFYLGTNSANGWPYIQHRGGPTGFLKVLGPRSLGFADLKGNRQLVSTGNLTGNDKVSLFLMSYPARERLKILGHAKVIDAREDPKLADRLSPSPGLRNRVERLYVIDVVGFDWNCPAYITPRFTQEDIEEYIRPLHARIAELEAKVKAGGAIG